MSSQSDNESRSSSILWLQIPSLWHNLVACKRWTQQATELTHDKLLIVVETDDIDKLSADPVASFRDIQGFIGHVYVAASSVAFALDRPLMQVEIIFNKYCGYDPLKLPDYEVLFVPDTMTCPKTTMEIISLAGVDLGEEDLVESAMLRRKWEEEDPDYIIRTPASRGLKVYDHTVLGGTFDHLHSGHRILLTMATWLASKSLTVGVTAADMLLNKQGADVMESIDVRIKTVQEFLQKFRVGSLVEGNEFWYNVTVIHDPFGPTKWDPKLQAIVGSKETLSGCLAVNKERANVNIPLLDIFVIQVISDSQANLTDLGAKMSSSNLRNYLLSKQAKQGKS